MFMYLDFEIWNLCWYIYRRQIIFNLFKPGLALAFDVWLYVFEILL